MTKTDLLQFIFIVGLMMRVVKLEGRKWEQAFCTILTIGLFAAYYYGLYHPDIFSPRV